MYEFIQLVEAEEAQCVTLALSCATSAFHPSAEAGKEVERLNKEKTTSGSLTWKLKWFSKDGVVKFIALLKAIHASTSKSPLPVRCIP